jgi:hypothetical protein
MEIRSGWIQCNLYPIAMFNYSVLKRKMGFGFVGLQFLSQWLEYDSVYQKWLLLLTN